MKRRLSASSKGNNACRSTQVARRQPSTLRMALRTGSNARFRYAVTVPPEVASNGTIQMARDRTTNLYLFPDRPKTLALFRQLQKGKLQKLRF